MVKEKEIETEKCSECGKMIPKADMMMHLREHLQKGKESTKEENDETQMPKLGNIELAKMITKSQNEVIRVRFIFLDKDTRESKNGDFRRALIEPVEGCQFDRSQYLVGNASAVGKRLEKALLVNELLLSKQFDVDLINNVVRKSRPFVDISNIIIHKKLDQLPVEEAEKYFPQFSGVNVATED